jgi:hypothetical protein
VLHVTGSVLAGKAEHLPTGVELINASKADIRAKLASIADIDDQYAEILLWRLAFDHKLSDEDVALTIRFLASTNSATYSAAVECFEQTDDKTILDTLRAYLESEEVFRVFRAASILHRKGDDIGFQSLISTIRDPATPLEQRRDLAWRLFGIDPRALFPVYLDLLEDPNKWMRYNAINQVRKVTEQDFGYDYEQKGDNSAAIAELKTWYQQNRDNLPTRLAPDIENSLAGIGASIRPDTGGVRVLNVMPGLGADKAGIQSNDLILTTNGYSTEGKTVIELVAYEFRGREGTSLDVTFRSHATGSTQAVTIVRQTIYSTKMKTER